MQIVIREIDATLKIDSVSPGFSGSGIAATPFGSSTDNAILSWAGTTGATVHSNNTLTLTTSALTSPSTITAQFLGAGVSSTRIGTGLANGDFSTSITGATCFADNGIAIGRGVSISNANQYGVAIGDGATISGTGPCLAVGSLSTASNGGVAYGATATALAAGIAFGSNSHAENGSIVIGGSATSNALVSCVVVGEGGSTSSNSSIGLGANVTIAAGNTGSIAAGSGASISGGNINGLCIGTNASITGAGPSFAIGHSSIGSDRGIAFGPVAAALSGGLAIGGASHSENFSIALGVSATTLNFSESVCIGLNATATGNNQLQLGTQLQPLKIHAYAGFGVWGHVPPASQPLAIADASGGANIDAEARTALNALLAAIRATGIINT